MNLLCQNNYFEVEPVLAQIFVKAREANRNPIFSKLNISLKEADETAYWLELLHESGYLTNEEFSEIYACNEEVIKLLVSITKKQKITQQSV